VIDRPSVWGHRGTRSLGERAGKPPENTLAAMRLALQQGADGIELDVRLCGSGEVVVLHDPDLKRMAGVAIRAQDATLAQLQAHDLGGGERVPTLEEAMDLVLSADSQLNVEIKADVPDEAALVVAVGRCVRARSAAERARIVNSSFSASICRAAQRELPEVAIAFLYEHASEASARPAGMEVVHPHHALLDASVIAELHHRGLTVNTWTVNDPARAVELARAGADGIITDDVTAILAALSAA
jgi:glycerophosphoryl diester phosphodiesterase